MAISLGGVQLSKHMVWENQYKNTSVKQDVKVTLGGNVAVYAQNVSKGELIKLTGYESGWLTRAMVQQLQVLANEAGAVMALELGSYSFDVIFAHHLGNAFVFDPISFRLAGEDTDYYKGELLLFTV